MLVGKGAPLQDKDNEGDGPMHWAAKRGDMDIMCTMFNAGACPKFPGKCFVTVSVLTFQELLYPRRRLYDNVFSIFEMIRSSWQQHASLCS